MSSQVDSSTNVDNVTLLPCNKKYNIAFCILILTITYYVYIYSPIQLTVAKCWDPNPKGYFTVPKGILTLFKYTIIKFSWIFVLLSWLLRRLNKNVSYSCPHVQILSYPLQVNFTVTYIGPPFIDQRCANWKVRILVAKCYFI